MGRLQIAVLGAGECGPELTQLAYDTGTGLAKAGASLICGGRGGVMAAASRGARAAGGTVIGILPGIDANESAPEPSLSAAIFTGIGQARNLSVVLSGAAAIAIGGGWGTLSEIGLALKHRIPVVVLESWDLNRPDGQHDPLLRSASSADEAVAVALEIARPQRLG